MPLPLKKHNLTSIYVYIFDFWFSNLAKTSGDNESWIRIIVKMYNNQPQNWYLFRRKPKYKQGLSDIFCTPFERQGPYYWDTWKEEIRFLPTRTVDFYIWLHTDRQGICSILSQKKETDLWFWNGMWRIKIFKMKIYMTKYTQFRAQFFNPL